MWKSISFVALFLVLSSKAMQVDAGRQRRQSADCPRDCTGTPLEISFVVDGSASIWPANFTFGLNFIEDFVNTFQISPSIVRVSLITFGERAYEEDKIDFDEYTDNTSLRQAIANIPYRSGIRTNTSGGIMFMLSKQKPKAREGVRHVVIVMTDGNSQERKETKTAAQAARADGLEVFAIGVGHSVSPEELHNIASDDRHVFAVASYNMLEGIKKRLVYQACDVPSYPECEMDPVDLSFVIDSSTSIGQDNFTVGMTFVKEFVDSFQVNPSAVRVSAVTFGEIVYEEDAFNFNTYPDKKELLDALSAITWRHGTATNTGAGIRYMREHQMIHSRPTAAHVCIVITDGQSQETEETAEQARLAQEAGIVTYAVGVGIVGKQLDEQELLNIAGDPARVITADNYAELNLIKEELTDLTCRGILSSLSIKATKFQTSEN